MDEILDGQLNIYDWLATWDDDSKVKPLSISKPIRMIELFAGYGSQAMAMKRLGVPFEHHFVCEFDKYALASYNAVHGTNFPTMDIRDVKGVDLNITDVERFTYLLTYSFPCTDLSVAGKRQMMSKEDWENGNSTRSGLLWEVERLLKEIVADGGNLPQLLMMENVIQVHGKGAKEDFDKWIAFLDSIGYYSIWFDLNAKDFGIPQNRNRCFMWSFLKSEFGEHPQYEIPKPIPLEKNIMSILEDEVDEKYFIDNGRAAELIKNLEASGEPLENSFISNKEDNITTFTKDGEVKNTIEKVRH